MLRISTRMGLMALALFLIAPSFGYVKGIYITEYTAQSNKKMSYLLREAKAVGINTFVIDVGRKNTRYARNVKMIQQHGIHYVARLVVFPHGGTHAQITNKKIWQKRWRQAQYAIRLGAKELQLDYIRYKKSNRRSEKNAHYVHEVIKYFKNKLKGTGVKLQIDIFGIAANKPSLHIGQNAKLFSNTVDVINPMVYPSHYEPFRYHAKRPYETVLESLQLLKEQVAHQPDIKIYAYIELFNYRYPMSYQSKVRYIIAQLKAVKDGGVHGWYAWSANNKYRILFRILRQQKAQFAKT